MKKQIAFVAGTALCVGAASAQMNSKMGAAGSILPSMNATEAGGNSNVRAPVVSSLTYDGTSTWGFAGQDFESVFDLYDTFVFETFSISADAELTEFRSTAFGSVNPFATEDIIVEIYPISDLGDLCDDANLPTPLLTSTPGAGFYDGVDGVSDFGGQCLAAGEYIIRWGGRLDFTTFGQIYFFGQAGAHDTGGGTADDGMQSNPGNAFGLGICFATNDGGTLLDTGVNYILCGEAGDCGDVCPDPNGCGDWDGDGDSDGDDFFGFLDDFSNGDPCADITGNGNIDGDDFFAFLDAFVQPC